MNWNKFWQTNKIIPIQDVNDLLFQAEWTVKGKPVEWVIINKVVSNIVKHLNIQKADIILDLCCGNGILTFEIANYADKIIGIDFSVPLIMNAKRYRSHKHINYEVEDALNLLSLKDQLFEEKPNKVILYGGLAYFKDKQLIKLLKDLFDITSSQSLVYFGSVLDDSRKWNFFNTLSRKLTYIVRFKLFRQDIGLSKWWKREEIKEIALNAGFNIEIIEQDPALHTSHYRFDILLKKIG